jgi:hypothetical protein
MSVFNWLKNKFTVPAAEPKPASGTGIQSPSFKDREEADFGPQNWNPPPCKCKAPVQQISGQLRCSQCGVQWWPGKSPEILYAVRDGGFVLRRAK